MTPFESPASAQPLVLVVDDDRDSLSLLSGILGEHGYSVRLAPSGRFALESARAAPPELILLDIGLPDLDGYTVCEQLKGDPRTQAVPVIFLSARHMTFDIVRAFAVGAADYITKPFATEEVLARIQAHLSVRQLQRQLQHHLAQLEYEISERKRAEAALREREELFRLTFEQSPIGAAMATLDYRFSRVNDALCAITGYTRDELLTRGFPAITHPDDVEKDVALANRLAAGEIDQYALEKRYLHKDGRTVWVNLHARMLRDVQGEPHYYLGLVEDISARKEAETELERARLAAEQATRAKSEFVAQISHEIRTPMNAVIGLTTLLLTSPLSPAQRDDVEVIRRSGSALLTLIDDILDFSKIEAGKLNLENRPFALGACVEEAIELLAPLADAKQLELRYLVDPALPHEIIGDQARLRQILINLLSNAVRFTERGEIEVNLAGKRRTCAAESPLWDITISVRDTGIGIAPAQLNRIFQPFEQASAAITREYGGSGLGLTISRRLAELMGAQVRAESTRGVGSTFTVELAAMATKTAAPADLAPSDSALAGRGALLLADRAEVAEMLSRQLTAWRMVSTVFAAAPDALAWLSARHPVDLVLLARKGANAHDIALVDEVRAAAGQPTLPVVMWAGVSQRGQLLDRVDHDSTALLSLPIRPGILHETLLRLLRGDDGAHLAHAHQIDATIGERHPLRILLAEDNIINQQVTQRLLAKLGYQADVAANGLDVLEALKRERYDLVFMDVQMPELSGIEATTYIHTFWSPERRPRIAAMTAYVSEEIRAQLLSIGMDDYIRKPVRLEELVRVLLSTRPRPPTIDLPAGNQRADRGSGALDTEVFAAFMASIGEQDPAANAAFITAYVAGMNGELLQIREAFSAADGARSTRAAHTLKGLSLQIGAMDLALLCGRIEAAGEGDHIEDGAALLCAAEAAYTALQRSFAERGVASDLVEAH